MKVRVLPFFSSSFFFFSFFLITACCVIELNDCSPSLFCVLSFCDSWSRSRFMGTVGQQFHCRGVLVYTQTEIPSSKSIHTQNKHSTTAHIAHRDVLAPISRHFYWKRQLFSDEELKVMQRLWQFYLRKDTKRCSLCTKSIQKCLCTFYFYPSIYEVQTTMAVWLSDTVVKSQSHCPIQFYCPTL